METRVEEERHLSDRGRELLPVGRWALWCSLASLLPLAVMVGIYAEHFCLANCPSVSRTHVRLISISASGLVAMALVTMILSIWSLVAHRQTGRAGAALLVLALISPFVYFALKLATA
jgi:hypothetical protein